MFQDRLEPFRFQIARLLRAHLIDRFVHVRRDMKSIQDVQGLRRFLGDDMQVRFPHVATDESQLLGPLLSQLPEKPVQRRQCAILSHPQQPLRMRVDLVDHRYVLMSFPPKQLVHADGGDPRQITVGQSPLDDPFHGSKYLSPGCVEDLGHLFPGQSPGPARQKLHVRSRQRLLTFSPWHRFHLHAAPPAVHAPHDVGEKSGDPPQRHKLE